MSTLTLRLVQKPAGRVDLSPLLPAKLAGKSLEAIGRMRLACGGRKVPLSSLFELEGETDALDTLHFKRSCNLLDNIGKGLEEGRIKVNGDVGDNLGREMRGGEITVRGDAGLWVGSAMSGGHIRIQGDVGDHLACARPGDPMGLKGGTIHVRGNAGDRIGDRMRRGIVLVEGDCGDYCGARMLAGTIVVLGQAGAFTGFSMKRGTLLLAHEPEHIPASFNDCGTLQLGFLVLLYRELAKMSSKFKKNDNLPTVVRRYAGDLSWDGKGELLILPAAP